MITVTLNENLIEIEENTSISQLLQKTNTSINGIAIAINNEIVSKTNWEIQQFNNNDNILIIKATQGG